MDKTRQAELLESVVFNHWNMLAVYLTEQSERICANNGCTEYDHHCESYAYISADGTMAGVCMSDCFQGWGSIAIELHGNVAAIPLPWVGNGQDLKSAIDADLPWDFD